MIINTETQSCTYLNIRQDKLHKALDNHFTLLLKIHLPWTISLFLLIFISFYELFIYLLYVSVPCLFLTMPLWINIVELNGIELIRMNVSCGFEVVLHWGSLKLLPEHRNWNLE